MSRSRSSGPPYESGEVGRSGYPPLDADARSAGSAGVEDPPPVLGSWRSFYVLEVVVLAAQILLYIWLGWIYR